jgi:hypothetical protein
MNDHLVPVLVHGFDKGKLERAILSDSIDCTIGFAQTNRSVSEPFPFQGLVVIPMHLTSALEPNRLDAPHPGHELAHDVNRALEEVLSSSCRENDDADHLL